MFTPIVLAYHAQAGQVRPVHLLDDVEVLVEQQARQVQAAALVGRSV